MFRFFRKFREKLLAQNEFSRYLLYATGEVILIVIGILVALAINNWNQDRIARDRERFYLEGLRSEFERSKIKLQNLIDINHSNYQESKRLAQSLSNKEDLPPEEKISQSLYKSFSSELSYNPNNSLLNELINSGGMEDISNEDLRMHLASWESFIQGIHRQEVALREQRDRVVSLFRAEEGNIKALFDDAGISKELDLPRGKEPETNIAVVQSREFENNLLLFILSGISTERSHYQPLLQEINTILELIDGELKNS